MEKATEITHICIDNSWRMNPIKHEAQLEAIEMYCQTKFAVDPHHFVGLSTMSTRQLGTLLPPTNDIQQIRRSLQDIHFDIGDYADFASVFMKLAGRLLTMPAPNMKKSLLLFVGSPICVVDGTSMRQYGDAFKKNGIAVNIVNFYVSERDIFSLRGWSGYSRINGEYRYGRPELNALVVAANNNNNSHLEDVKDPSSVREILSKSILKKDLLHIEKKHSEENVDVKQQSHKESVNVKASGIKNYKKLEQDHNEKNKSAANDEIVQPPWIKQYPAKKTPPSPTKWMRNSPDMRINPTVLLLERIKKDSDDEEEMVLY